MSRCVGRCSSCSSAAAVALGIAGLSEGTCPVPSASSSMAMPLRGECDLSERSVSSRIIPNPMGDANFQYFRSSSIRPFAPSCSWKRKTARPQLVETGPHSSSNEVSSNQRMGSSVRSFVFVRDKACVPHPRACEVAHRREVVPCLPPWPA